MRVYGRVYSELGIPTWIEVQTNPNVPTIAQNDYVYVTAMIQELKLNLGESPFWGDRGIPAAQSIIQQIAPDYYTMLMQGRYAPFFMNLVIYKDPFGLDSDGKSAPFYRINITTHLGVQVELQVPT